MKKIKLDDMIGGWFIGNFTPTVLNNSYFEAGVKYYKKGDFENAHYHKISTEYTVIVEGEVKMNNIIYKKGDIIVISPMESTDFIALTDVTTTVIKIPSSINDKYNL
jgi:quercetin dioxygenase-like cupin family protein